MIVAFHSYSGITCESGSFNLWNSTLRNDNFYPRSTNKTFSYLRKTFVVLHFLWSINGQYLTHFYRDFYSFYKESFNRGKFRLMQTHRTGKSRDKTKVTGIKKRITMGDLAMQKVAKAAVQLGDRSRFQDWLAVPRLFARCTLHYVKFYPRSTTRTDLP